MSTAAYNIGELLEQAGAHPRGNRYDCPECGGVRTITHADDVFYCHKCQWKGNSITLAKELGVYERLSPEEYREIRRSQEEAREAAEQLFERVKARRFELYDNLQTLARVEIGAHKAGPDQPETWGALAVVYQQRPVVVAELAFLENGHARPVSDFLEGTAEQRRAVCDGVLECGGLVDHSGRFVEVCQ